MNTNRVIRKLAERQAAHDSEALPVPHTVRTKPKAELERIYIPYGYHSLVCLHDKLYFEACSACRRTSAEGQQNFIAYINKQD